MFKLPPMVVYSPLDTVKPVIHGGILLSPFLDVTLSPQNITVFNLSFTDNFSGVDYSSPKVAFRMNVSDAGIINLTPQNIYVEL